MFSISTDVIAPKSGKTVDLTKCVLSSQSYTFSAPVLGGDASAPATVTATVSHIDGCYILSYSNVEFYATAANSLTTPPAVNPLPPATDTALRFQYEPDLNLGQHLYPSTIIIKSDGSLEWRVATYTGAATLHGTTLRYF